MSSEINRKNIANVVKIKLLKTIVFAWMGYREMNSYFNANSKLNHIFKG